MNRTGIPYLDFCWNPCGFGCSHGCPTCWARRQATSGSPTSPQCPDCKAFKVHFHPERLTGKLAPASRKKPAVVGVQFVGDLFDPKRHYDQASSVLDVVFRAPQHTFVFLSQQYEAMFYVLRSWALTGLHQAGFDAASTVIPCLPASWHIGTTCHSQVDYEDASRHMCRLGWNWWVSAEPLQGPIKPRRLERGERHPEAIIIGADNQPDEPYNIEWHRQTARAFTDAGVKVYVKQLWMWQCPNCGDTTEGGGKGLVGGLNCRCGTPGSEFHHRLISDHPELFPADLRRRELPWNLAMEKKP